MYKYINGNRLPPKQELVERIADYMRLSPSEHDELLTAWKIALIGEEDFTAIPPCILRVIGDAPSHPPTGDAPLHPPVMVH